jgi:hypothetical protein
VFHRENEVLRAGTGLAVPGATITVYVNGTDTAGDYTNATKATIYPTNVVGTPIENATLVADANGEYSYFAPDGIYDEVMRYGSVTDVDTYIQMFDLEFAGQSPGEAAAAAEAAATVATTQATAASVSASNAAASEANAAASASAAATSATAASTARDQATTSANNAAASANSASDSASSAAVSETNAAASAVLAQTPPGVTTQAGTSYTGVLGDANKYIRFTNAAAVGFTIPPNSAVAYPVGTVIEMEQAGAGALTVVAGAGVTINSRGADLTLAGQFAVAALKKVATDTWTLAGDL